MKAKGTGEGSFLRPLHFLEEKETAGKRVKVNGSLSLECMIWFAHSSGN